MDAPATFPRFILLFTMALTALLSASRPTGVLATELTPLQSKGVTIRDAWARASAGNASAGAAYITIIGGAQADQLVAVGTPVAATAEVHQSFTENGVMKMRPVLGLAVPAGQTVTLAPGGAHIMLMGLKQPLVAGQNFPLTLTFAHAAPVTVDVGVQPLGRGAPMVDQGHPSNH